MPVVPMQKVAVCGHLAARPAVLAVLQKNELLEITPLPSLPQPAENWELELTELEFVIKLLDQIAGRKKSFIESFAPPKERVGVEVIEQTAREFDWRSLVAQVKDLEARLSNLRNLEQTLLADIATLLPWRGLDAPLNRLTCVEHVCFLTGSCKPKDLAIIDQKLAKFSPAVQLEVVQATKERLFVLIVHLAAEAQGFAELLGRLPLEVINLPDVPRTPDEEIRNLEKLLTQTRQDQTSLLGKIKKLLRHRTSLTYVYDHVYQKNLEQAAREKFAYTEKAFVLAGWVPQQKVERLKAEIKKATPLAEVVTIAPEEKEIAPTLIENHPILYPFELITRIFGLPAQGEIDPTGPLSFFYLLFFAMCLSDVGYGIILALLAWYYLRTLTLMTGGKKLLLLLFWGGIATVLVGILTGSYFGIDTAQLPPLLQRLQLIDPIKKPLNVLILSLALGVVQNLCGVALALYWKFRKGDYLSGLLDDGLWIFFLVSLVGLVVSLGVGSPLSGLFGKLSIAGAVLLVLTQGRNEQGLAKKAAFGILSLYKTTGYLGDTLSYSRLLALMMTTSIIGMVINIIAGMTKNIPVIGYLVMVLILLVGHTFNLVVSTLGAFIHATRLQLVEFFGKFYGNGGREFRPFRRETKYVIITE